jgi:hypothetical protein
MSSSTGHTRCGKPAGEMTILPGNNLSNLYCNDGGEAAYVL